MSGVTSPFTAAFVAQNTRHESGGLDEAVRCGERAAASLATIFALLQNFESKTFVLDWVPFIKKLSVLCLLHHYIH